MFVVRRSTNTQHCFYYIACETSNGIIVDDFDIADLLDISYFEYRELLSSYGQWYEDTLLMYNYFSYKDNANDAVNYLNKTYLVMLKLTNRI